jgi:hypothetical protein
MSARALVQLAKLARVVCPGPVMLGLPLARGAPWAVGRGDGRLSRRGGRCQSEERWDMYPLFLQAERPPPGPRTHSIAAGRHQHRQYAGALTSGGAASRRRYSPLSTGSVNQKVEPVPGALATPTCP